MGIRSARPARAFDEGAALGAGPLDFRGSGVTASVDPATGRTLVTVPGSGVDAFDAGLTSRLGMTTPEKHGAVGDNVADDLAAIQAAVNEVQGEGGVVFLSRKYVVSNKIVVTGNVVFLGNTGIAPYPLGVGWGGWLPNGNMGPNSSIRTTHPTADIISFEPTSVRSGGIENVALYSDTQKTGGAGIRTNQNCWGMRFVGVVTSRTYDGIIIAAASNGQWKTYVDRCQVLDPTHWGIAVTNTTFGGEVYIENTEVICYPGVGLVGVVGLYIGGASGCWYTNLSILGFAVGVELVGQAEYQYFKNVICDLCQLGWWVTGGGSAATRVRHIYLDTCYATSDSVNAGVTNVGGFLVQGANKDTWLENCSAGRYQGAGQYGCRIAGPNSENVRLRDFSSYDLDLTGSSRPYTALDISGGTTGLQISGGRFEAQNKSIAFGSAGHSQLQIAGANFPNGYSGTYPTANARVGLCLPSTGGAGVAFTDL